MTTVHRNTNLHAQSRPLDFWETCAACADNVVVYTGNWGAACSVDGGLTFQPVDPNTLCSAHGEKLCCDQVVIYSSAIDAFLWLIQTDAGNYVLGVASPAELQASKGLTWATYLIPADRFGGSGAAMDFPEVAMGAHYLYVTFNVMNGERGNAAVGLRLSLSALADRGTLWLSYFRAPDVWFMRPVQSTGDVGYFAVLKSMSEVRVYAWDEEASFVTHADMAIATIPTERFDTPMPAGFDWLQPSSKIGVQILGATRAQDQIWVAWHGARHVPDTRDDAFPHPQIGIAVVDTTKWTLTQRWIWNREHAFVWPTLATNLRGDVGISFAWGGNDRDPQMAVGMLTGPGASTQLVSSGLTNGAGGHYQSIRTCYPNVNEFCASGFNQIRSSETPENHPHYVVFGD